MQYYMHDGPTAFRFELAGNLDHKGARRLDQDWRTASSVIGDRRLIVDMTFVTGVDEEGRALLSRWDGEGALLIANSRTSRALAESILGEPLVETPANSRGVPPGRTWRPWTMLLLLAAFGFPIEGYGAALKSETIAAWDNYLRAANVNLQNRVRPGGSFLWALEDAERAAKVHAGEIVVAPAPGQDPKKVPGGLIHHWMGTMFLRNVKLDDILEITRDYDHYKEFYRPSVIDSKAIARNDASDKFSMRIMNQAFFLKTALEADYQATHVRLDDHRMYTISSTTRVQEIEEIGRTDERRIPEGEGSGYIWKLYSIARFEQRDDGLYVELEAMALSREIPAAVRFVVNPIVRRVSRNALLTSLQQTEEAVCGFGTIGRCAGVPATAGQMRAVPATAGQMRAVPASLSKRSSAFARVH